MIDGEEDRALVIRSRGGDRAAFELLVARTARGIYARIFIVVGDAHRAEDLTQETFLRAWKRIGTLADPNLFRAWLRTIAKGVAIDAAKHDARKKRGWFKRNDPEALLDLADESDQPIESADRDEQQKRVLRALEDLPREYRDVISLRYLSGADYQTIAKQLAISNGSLRGLLARGMKMLREKIGTTDEHG